MTGTRRVFLGAMSWAAMARALKGAPAGPRDESYWSLVKRQFPLEPTLLYFNAANVAPASRGVLDRHAEFLRDFHANPSFQNREKYGQLRALVKTKLARLLGASSDEIAILRNTSEANNLIAQGLDLKPGDEVLITDHNHPSNLESWRLRAARAGFTLRVLPVRAPAASTAELVSMFEKAITDRTRVISATHITNVTGLRFPIKEIAALARPRKIWVHADGAQSFGMLDINLKELGCDSFSGSAHKWLMGPLEAGILYVRSERLAETWPLVVSAGFRSELKGSARFDVLGQQDDPRLAGLDAALDFLELVGPANVEARVRTLTTHLKQQAAEMPGVTLLTNPEWELSGGIVKFSTGGANLNRHYDLLWTRHRISISRTASGPAAGLRFSPHIYTTREDLDRTIQAVRQLLA